MGSQVVGNNIFQAILGKDGAGDFYTVVPGTFVYIGTDGAGVAKRAIPTTDVDAHKPVGVVYNVETADVEDWTKSGEIPIAAFPFTLQTDNVASGAEPEAAENKMVYLLDAGTLSDTDTNTAGYTVGQCVAVDTTKSLPYTINCDGIDET